jgi:hypothetical protein
LKKYNMDQNKTKEKPDIMSTTQKRVQAALAHVKHPTIIIKHSPIDSAAITSLRGIDDNLSSDVWSLLDFMSARAKAMPGLKSLRIALHRPHMLFIDDEHLASWIQPHNREELFVLPSNFGGLKLHQNGEGYAVGFGETWEIPPLTAYGPAYWAFMIDSALPNSPAVYRVDGKDFSMAHEMHRVGVYTYFRDDEQVPKQGYWTGEKVMEMLKEQCGVQMRKYPDKVLGNVGAAKREALEGFAGGLTA